MLRLGRIKRGQKPQDSSRSQSVADTGGTKELVTQLTVAEYNSVRSEVFQSLSMAQAIIQWSLAAYGVLFGAGLVAATVETSILIVPAAWMAAVTYVLLIPGLVFSAAWSWIGEIRRMQRAGVYLRGLERHISSGAMVDGVLVNSPLNWERYIILAGTDERYRTKGWIPDLGTPMLFFGAIVASDFFGAFWLRRLIATDGWSSAIWVVIVSGTVVFAVFVVVLLASGRQVKRLGRIYFDFADAKLTEISPDSL